MVIINYEQIKNKIHEGLVYSFSDKSSLKEAFKGNENELLDKKLKRPAVELFENITYLNESIFAQITSKNDRLGFNSVKIEEDSSGVHGDILVDRIFIAKKSDMKPYTNDLTKTTHAKIGIATSDKVISEIPGSAIEKAFYTRKEPVPDGLLKFDNPHEEWLHKFSLMEV